MNSKGILFGISRSKFKNESFRSKAGNNSHYSGNKNELSDQNTSGIIQIFTDRIREMIRKNENRLLFKSLEKMDLIYKKEIQH